MGSTEAGCSQTMYSAACPDFSSVQDKCQPLDSGIFLS